jgi:hypothetical protein
MSRIQCGCASGHRSRASLYAVCAAVRWTSSDGRLGVAVSVLWKVNQVLVRLWARNRLPVVGGPLSEVSDDGLQKTGGWSFVGCMSDRECRLQGWRPNGRRREFRGVVNDFVESGCRAVVQATKGKSVREDPVMCGVKYSGTVLKQWASNSRGVGGSCSDN